MPEVRRKRLLRPEQILVIGLLPWLTFTLLASLFCFAYHDYKDLVWILAIMCLLLGVLFIVIGVQGGRNSQFALGFLLASAVAMAVPVGLLIQDSFMKEYWKLNEGATYHFMNPQDPGSWHADASIIEFMEGSFLDDRTVGYMEVGRVYCVTPVSANQMSPAPTYWAAGENCCSERGHFTCGDAKDSNARSGIVIKDTTGNYATAVRVASSVYGMSLGNTTPTFVAWTKNAQDSVDSHWNSAAATVVVASIMHLLLSFAAALLLNKASVKAG